MLIFQQTGFAQVASTELNISGYFTSLSRTVAQDTFRPLHLRSLSYDRLNNNFKLTLDKGDNLNLQTQEIESITKDLLNYFLVGLTLPNTAFWVNLRPDSPQEIIDPFLAQTEVGRILLEADLQLKKDTADATSPQCKEGREYWNKLYRKAGEIYGTQNVTIPTLVRPWIVPQEIIIRESIKSAHIYKATLKVILEQDYLKDNSRYAFKDEKERQLNEYSAQIIREEIIPKLNKEINSAKRYAALRQVYYSLILAQWFKARNRGTNTEHARKIDSKNLTGLYAKTGYAVNAYFDAYKENFAKGQYNIKEPVSTPYGQVIRSYFSGGIADIAPVFPELGGLPIGPVMVFPVSEKAVQIPQGSQERTAEISPGFSIDQGRKWGDQVQEDFGKVTVLGEQVKIDDEQKVTILVDGQEDKREDLSRRAAIDRLNHLVDDYERFDESIEVLIRKIKRGENLEEEDLVLLRDLKNRIILKNSLVAMHIKVHQGDIIVVSNQPSIKLLNSLISEQGTDMLIELRKKIITELLIKAELIEPNEQGILSLSFKYDRFVIKSPVVERLGREELLKKLNAVAWELTAQLNSALRSRYQDKVEMQEYVFSSQFGVSSPVSENSDDARIEADMQALQSAKMARRLNLRGYIYDQAEFDELMAQAYGLIKELGFSLGQLPSEEELKAVRGKTEQDLESEVASGQSDAKKRLVLKKYLDIIDMFDYQKTWRANPKARSSERDAILNILERLDAIIQKTGPPESFDPAKILELALTVLKVNSKHTWITSGEAFYANAVKLLEKEDGRIIAVDLDGFWAKIQKSFALAHKVYMEGVSESENRGMLMERLSLEADDSVKEIMAQKLQDFMAVLGQAIPQIEVGMAKISLVRQEGGDEIVFFIPASYDWDRLVNELASKVSGVRVMSTRVPIDRNKILRSEEAELGKSLTAVTHDMFGEAYVSAQSADEMVKKLEKLGVNSAVLSLDTDETGQPQWYVYYRGSKNTYDSFYQGLTHTPSVSSTGFGDETQANRNILDGILTILVRKGMITEAERQRRLGAFDADPKTRLTDDLDLAVDNQNVYLINGQMVVVIDAPYLSVTEEGEQYASAGLRRGVVYITRSTFNEWQKQGILEQQIKHEQDEVSYLRKKALEIFPGLDEVTAYELLSDFLKDPANQKQARDLISEAHQFALSQRHNADAAAIQAQSGAIPIYEGIVVETGVSQLLLTLLANPIVRKALEFLNINRINVLKPGLRSNGKKVGGYLVESGVRIKEGKSVTTYQLAVPSDAEASVIFHEILHAVWRNSPSIREYWRMKGWGKIKTRDRGGLGRELQEEEAFCDLFEWEMFSVGGVDSRVSLEAEGEHPSRQERMHRLQEIQKFFADIINLYPDLRLSHIIEVLKSNSSQFSVVVEDSVDVVPEQASVLDLTAAPQEDRTDTGGIDFRYLPIVTQSLDNLQASIRSIPASSLQSLDLIREWSDIGRLVNSGIIPSSERLKEYLAASFFKENLDNDLEKIVACIAGILRSQEASFSLTDQTFKDILVVLGSGKITEKLKLVVAN